jgi:hypothetical protein
MKALLAIALLVPASATLLAQNQTAPIKVPQVLNRGLGMVITPYTDRPPDITLLPHGPGARRGQVWVQDLDWGLLIVGEVDGDPPEFPRNKNLILEKDHVEIWLADGKDPELPAMGWGNQFQEITLPKGTESCPDWAKKDGSVHALAREKKCRRWAQTQSRYRRYFKRLFVRQWLVTPNYAVESFASPAYDEITARFASDQSQGTRKSRRHSSHRANCKCGLATVRITWAIPLRL